MKVFVGFLLLLLAVSFCFGASLPADSCNKDRPRHPLFLPVNFGWYIDTSYIYFTNERLQYHMQVATDSLFSNIIYEKSNIQDKYNGTQRILPDTTIWVVDESTRWQYFNVYWWRVRTIKDTSYISGWSCMGWFSVKDPSYTNPFTLRLQIKYSVPVFSPVNISIFDNSGQFVMELINKNHDPGAYICMLDESKLNNGIYTYRITVNSYIYSSTFRVIK